MRMLAEFFPEFVQKLDELDELKKKKTLLMKELTSSFALRFL